MRRTLNSLKEVFHDTDTKFPQSYYNEFIYIYSTLLDYLEFGLDIMSLNSIFMKLASISCIRSRRIY